MAKDTCGSAGVPRQFDRFCQMILKGEVMDYYRHLNYMQQNEIGLSALSEEERKQLYCEDEYEGRDYTVFQAMEYDICVKNSLLAEALDSIAETGRTVVLLAYYMDMSDAEIAEKMHCVRSTSYRIRKQTLKKIKKRMEALMDEEKAIR